MKEGWSQAQAKRNHGRHLQLGEAVQSRKSPIGVLYCARDVVMVQLPVEKERKEGDEETEENRDRLC